MIFIVVVVIVVIIAIAVTILSSSLDRSKGSTTEKTTQVQLRKPLQQFPVVFPAENPSR
jgi:heme/copper-type cytochrome/quinol oxidase subunit 2